MVEPASALGSAIARGGRDGADGARALRISEVRGLELVQLGVHAGGADAVARAVEPLLGVPLPVDGTRPVGGRVRVHRIAADQYWVVSRDRGLAARLAAAIPPEAGCVTSLSHGRVRIALEGSPAREALETLVPIDLHPATFAVGSCAQTGTHHIAVLLERTGPDRYELVVQRTFAQALWELLADAALRHGYDI
jgi:heterotetrameric sarcosine oxidase gamma subunit